MRYLAIFLFLIVGLLEATRSGNNGATAADGPAKKGALVSPLSPQEAMKHFRLTAGLRLELVARVARAWFCGTWDR